MWDVICKYGLQILNALFIQIVLYLLAYFLKFIKGKFELSKMKFNLNGKWLDEHFNFDNELVLEKVDIKHVNNEISIAIHQYKRDTLKKYRGKGVISGNSVALYYFDTNAESPQAGTLILDIKDDGKGYSWLEGEYLESIDIKIRNRKKNLYKLYRTKFTIKDKIKLAFSSNKFETMQSFINK